MNIVFENFRSGSSHSYSLVVNRYTVVDDKQYRYILLECPSPNVAVIVPRVPYQKFWTSKANIIWT